jgi:hypothetical protein
VKEIRKSESLLQKYEKDEVIKLLEEERKERLKEMDKFKSELQNELLKFEHNLSSLIMKFSVIYPIKNSSSISKLLSLLILIFSFR